jgi:signal transduction histidine kinase
MAVLAVRANGALPHANEWLTGLDIAVGVVIAAGAALAPGRAVQRWLVATVGFAWLAGSLAVGLQGVHQAALAIALVAFPGGRVHGAVRWLLVGGASVIALRPPQYAVAALFAAIAGGCLIRRRDGPGVWYPVLAAGGMAATLAVLAWFGHAEPAVFDPTLGLVAYELILVLVAVGFPFAARAAIRDRRRLADQVYAVDPSDGLRGLAAVLGRVLGDPNLAVYRWSDVAAESVNERDGVVVSAGGQPVALVVTRSAALEDEPTAAAVATAVRLTMSNMDLLAEQDRRYAELQASRARLVAASDRQRERAAEELRDGVEALLRRAREALAETRPGDGEGAEVLTIVEDQLTAASREIAGLVAGVPPAGLGRGRLRGALETLGAASPVPVTVQVAAGSGGNADAEAALYYACSEALANAVKHAQATQVKITVYRVGGEMVAEIVDDGSGGADPSGSGLQGLADRLASCGGRLRVRSAPGAGTTVAATVPG